MSSELVRTGNWSSHPYTLTNSSVSGGKLIIVGGALDSYAQYSLAGAIRPSSGGRKGLRIQFTLERFSIINDTSGGLAPVVLLAGAQSSQLSAKVGRILTWNGVDAAAISLSTEYRLDGLYTEDGLGGIVTLWIDGSVTAINKSRSATLVVGTLEMIQHGLLGGLGKISYDFRFGNTVITAAKDPQ